MLRPRLYAGSVCDYSAAEVAYVEIVAFINALLGLGIIYCRTTL